MKLMSMGLHEPRVLLLPAIDYMMGSTSLRLALCAATQRLQGDSARGTAVGTVRNR